MDKEQINSTCDLLDFWEDFDESMLSTDFGIIDEKADPSPAQLDEQNTSQQIELIIHGHTPYRISISIQL